MDGERSSEQRRFLAHPNIQSASVTPVRIADREAGMTLARNSPKLCLHLYMRVFTFKLIIVQIIDFKRLKMKFKSVWI